MWKSLQIQNFFYSPNTDASSLQDTSTTAVDFPVATVEVAEVISSNRLIDNDDSLPVATVAADR